MNFPILLFLTVTQGIASAPQTAFSTIYIDEATHSEKTGLYLGVVYALQTMGLAVGGGAGFLVVNTYFSLEGKFSVLLWIFFL